MPHHTISGVHTVTSERQSYREYKVVSAWACLFEYLNGLHTRVHGRDCEERGACVTLRRPIQPDPAPV